MKKIHLIALAIVLSVAGLLFSISRPSEDNNAATSEGSTVSATEKQSIGQIHDALDNGAVLLDVRTPEEFSAGHFERATLLPLAAIEAGDLPSVDKSKTVYVYCRSGNRSAEASALLRQAGFSDVIDLGGLGDVAALGGKQVR